MARDPNQYLALLEQEELKARAGDQAAKSLLEALELTDEDQEAELHKQYRLAYERTSNFVSEGGVTYERRFGKGGEELLTPLASCSMLIRQEVTRDDGISVTKSFVLEGVLPSAKRLPAVTIPASRFASMAWVPEHWGAAANIYPGSTMKDKLRFAVQQASAGTLQQSTVYSHSGWRVIDGQYGFLHQGGAIGLQGVRVEQEGALGNHLLPGRVDDRGEAARASFGILQVAPPRLAVPILAHAYLAPLVHFLTAAGTPPAFVLFFAGGTGTRKTTLAALEMAHFGPAWNPKRLPASFADTANALRRKAFLAKDVPFLVDDFHPSSDPQERRVMLKAVHALATAYGDGGGRGRMRADLTLEEAQPPRGLAVVTGEDSPAITESGLARFYSVHVKAGDIPISAALNAAQSAGERGLLAQSMRAYIEDLLPQTDTLSGRLGDLFREYRAQALKDLAGPWARLAEAAAWLLIGWRFALDHFVRCGALDEDAATLLLLEGRQAIYSNVRDQQHSLQQERPGDLFLEALRELRQAGKVQLRDATFSSDNTPAGSTFIGYFDDSGYYLIPTVAFGAVYEHFSRSGRVFPISRPQLWKRLLEDGVAQGEGKSPTRVRYIPATGASDRYLCITRASLDGPQGPVDRLLQQGFTLDADCAF